MENLKFHIFTPIKKMLYFGDNIKFLRQLPSNSIDLIYTDIPFSSNKKYTIFKEDKYGKRHFNDKFAEGRWRYLLWLRARIRECHRILKETGSLFLHCDKHMGHYVKCDVLDNIFGINNFKNEIIWRYKSGGKATKKFQQNHDNIFFYVKSKKDYKFLPILKEKYHKIKMYDKNTPVKSEGIYFDDVWEDISSKGTAHRKKEFNIDFPTQKPLDLAKRIILCSTKENDIVLDPFLGSGTTLVAARDLNRNCIGIEEVKANIIIAADRLNYKHSLIAGFKSNIQDLRELDDKELEYWYAYKKNGYRTRKPEKISGVDVIIPTDWENPQWGNHVFAQVKGGSTPIQKGVITRFFGTLIDHNRKGGYIAGFEFSRGAIEMAGRYELQHGIHIKLEYFHNLLNGKITSKNNYTKQSKTKQSKII